MVGDFKIGDVDGDGKDPITVDDLIALVDVLENGSVDSVGQAIRADITGDENVSIDDLAEAARIWVSDGSVDTSGNPQSNLAGPLVNNMPHLGIVYTVDKEDRVDIGDQLPSEVQEQLE